MALFAGLLALAACQGPSEINGIVFDAAGPISGATVRIQATDIMTLTDAAGRFTLSGTRKNGPVSLNAWKESYYSTRVENVGSTTSGIQVELHRYQTDDNSDYLWALPSSDNPAEFSCTQCKADVVAPWAENAHAGSATNSRFLTMYNGTDMAGNRSPDTRYGFSRDYGRFPLLPNLDEPYFGPGYKLDFPDTTGNCAACHIPGAAVDAPYGTDPNEIEGVNTLGVHCDYCHKVAEVLLDPITDLPYPNMPGVLSSDVRRPFTDDPERPNLFFGPFDDPNVDEGDTYLPLIQESAFCAPCHFGTFWDTPIYNSYGEWLDSSYSDPETGKTCQECHMPAPTLVDGVPMTNIAPENEIMRDLGIAGVERDPLAIRAHTQLGAMDQEFLQQGLTMTADAIEEEGSLEVRVTITNDNTGHHFPTDNPLRHLILLIGAMDSNGTSLRQTSGPTLPAWCGVGDPENGYYAGSPGKAFAKVLEELWTQISPTGAYWNPTRIVSDTRLAAFETDQSSYGFELPDRGQIEVRVVLILRRAYINLMDQKQWETPDILVAEEMLQIQY